MLASLNPFSHARASHGLCFVLTANKAPCFSSLSTNIGVLVMPRDCHQKRGDGSFPSRKATDFGHVCVLCGARWRGPHLEHV